MRTISRTDRVDSVRIESDAIKYERFRCLGRVRTGPTVPNDDCDDRSRKFQIMVSALRRPSRSDRGRWQQCGGVAGKTFRATPGRHLAASNGRVAGGSVGRRVRRGVGRAPAGKRAADRLWTADGKSAIFRAPAIGRSVATATAGPGRVPRGNRHKRRIHKCAQRRDYQPIGRRRRGFSTDLVKSPATPIVVRFTVAVHPLDGAARVSVCGV